MLGEPWVRGAREKVGIPLWRGCKVAAKRPFFGHGEEHKIPLPLGHAGWQAPVGLRTPLREPSRGASVGSALPGMAEPHDKIKINPQPLRAGNEERALRARSVELDVDPGRLGRRPPRTFAPADIGFLNCGPPVATGGRPSSPLSMPSPH
jgi:hypothetical protein